jgi:hypothetical protein
MRIVDPLRVHIAAAPHHSQMNDEMEEELRPTPIRTSRFGTLPSESGHRRSTTGEPRSRFQQHTIILAWNKGCGESFSLIA